MLTQLSIRNFGLIEDLNIEFHERLNVLTGETGAGKSIVIDALRAALGGKLNAAQLRVDDQPCTLEAVFDLGRRPELIKALEDYVDKSDATLVIRRVLMPEGRHQIKVNGQAVNVGQLKSIGAQLVDFHGAHDHQILHNAESHLKLLDQLCDFGESLKKYEQAYTHYARVKKEIEQLASLSQNREREMDLLGHQINELEQVKLVMDHYIEIEQQKIKIGSVAKLSALSAEMLELLDGDGPNAAELLRRCFAPMKKLIALDEHSRGLENQLNALQGAHDALVLALRDYGEGLSFNEEEAENIHQQSDTYYTILRKYGPQITDAAAFYAQAKEKYELLSNWESRDGNLRTELKKYHEECRVTAEAITKVRKKRAKVLQETMERELKTLGIEHVAFEVRFAKKEFSPDGADTPEFYISPNAGEGLKPLAQIASCGEAARVMLAIKKALIEVDPVAVLVFDEIDAQIGGRLGTVTGQKLRSIAGHRQVLLITHLPQIASFADNHLKVTKSVVGARSLTQVTSLNAKERVREVAQMMSGKAESTVSLKHAENMLEVARF